ncbi:MAG: four helix bundle protein [Candidatus Peribacteraceae bacterium]
MAETSCYDLEDRTCNFAGNIRRFVRDVPRTVASIEDCKQLIRSSGSVAANYIEANESLSRKDFLFRIKICRKESKESMLWLRLIDVNETSRLGIERAALLKEARELMLIFGSILQKSQ